MDLNHISPDHTEFFRWGFVRINATLVYTWVVMALLVAVSVLATRRLSSGPRLSRWQNLLEVVVGTIRDQIRAISNRKGDEYLPLIGTLFLFILVANLLSLVPGLSSPTASLSTTTALALCVFFAVPLYTIRRAGVWAYLKNYMHPTPIMLPFNIISELSRPLALAVRLFGNIMSGEKIAAILLLIAPLFVPVLVNLLGLLVGVIQAYIFAILALVFIASAAQTHQESAQKSGGAHPEKG